MSKESAALLKAIQNFKMFYHRQPTAIEHAKINIDFKNEKLVFIGVAYSLDYLCDKAKDKSETNNKILRIHCHDYKSPLMVFTNAKRNAIYITPSQIDADGIKN